MGDSPWIAPWTCCNGCGEAHAGDHHLCPGCDHDSAITTWGDAQYERWLSGERYAANGGRGHPDLASGPPLDWIIVGGESGPGARPFDLAWARSTIEQCRAAGVPCFVKQLGARPRAFGSSEVTERDLQDALALDAMRDRKGGDMDEWPPDLRVREEPG